VVLSSLEERSRVRDPELPQLRVTSSPSRSSGSVFLDGGQATFCQVEHHEELPRFAGLEALGRAPTRSESLLSKCQAWPSGRGIALCKAIDKHAHGRDLLKTEPLENRL
jgi:hypothetical protein